MKKSFLKKLLETAKIAVELTLWGLPLQTTCKAVGFPALKRPQDGSRTPQNGPQMVLPTAHDKFESISGVLDPFGGALDGFEANSFALSFFREVHSGPYFDPPDPPANPIKFLWSSIQYYMFNVQLAPLEVF